MIPQITNERQVWEPNDAVGSAIRLLEQSLAELVDEVASPELGADWVIKEFPHLRDVLAERQRPEGALKFGVCPTSPVGYLYLGELKQILVSKRFWPRVKGRFENKDRLGHLLDIVQEVRPAWAHPAATTIDPQTACYVFLTAKKLLTPINPGRASQVDMLFRSSVGLLAEGTSAIASDALGLLSRAGISDTMRLLSARPLALSQSELIRSVENMGVNNAGELVSSLRQAGWCLEIGGRLTLSRLGRQVVCLSEGLVGGDIRKVVRELLNEFPELRTYELVTEGMTHRFIEELYEDPTFGSVYLASPWIDLNERLKSLLLAAIDRAESYSGQEITLIVITRPPSGASPWKKRLAESIEWLRALRADIQFVSALHTKLFLREPGKNGGSSTALFGSENLTRGRNLELGIKIRNDSSISRQLVQHFFELYSSKN